MYFFKLFLFCIISCLIGFVISAKLELCENGGVSFQGHCICPPHFRGKFCQFTNNDTKCTQAWDESVYVGHFCCWSKHRTDNQPKTDLENSNWKLEDHSGLTQNQKLKNILKYYGPWTRNDLLYLNHIFQTTKIQGSSANRHKYVYTAKHQNLIEEIETPSSCTDDNLSPPLAFSLLIHNINISSLETLFSILYKPKHYYVIHLDHNYKNKEEKIKLEKALMNFYEMSDNPLGYPYNIKLMEETFHGNWGSPALVYMEVASYTHLFDMVNQRISALNESEKPKSSYQWSHVINLSLNDMPLVPLSRLQQYFCTNLNTSYIQSYHESYDERYSISLMEKSDTQYHDVSHHLFEKYECGLDGCNHYYNRSIARYGTQWHMLTYKFVHFMISDMRAIERMFQMKFSVIPDETYFQQANQIFMNDVETKRTYHSQNVISTQLQSSTIKRHTMWNRGDHKNRYEVLIPDLEQFLINNRKDNEDKHIFFIRKVYDQEVKDHIINNFINIK